MLPCEIKPGLNSIRCVVTPCRNTLVEVFSTIVKERRDKNIQVCEFKVAKLTEISETTFFKG
jgi:hypothetical protein